MGARCRLMVSRTHTPGPSAILCPAWRNDTTFKILFRCYELGLIIISVAGNVLRVQPPLNIETGLLEKAFDIIDEAMIDYENGDIPDEVLKYKAGW